MAYSKAKLKSSDDKASPFLDHSEYENYQMFTYIVTDHYLPMEYIYPVLK
jgi:hypothetical protein